MFDPTIAIWLLLGTFVFFILVKMPVTFALAVSSCLTLVYCNIPLMAFIQQMGKSVNSFSLMAIPFFILSASDNNVFRNDNRICFGTDQFLIPLNHSLLVKNAVLNIGSFMNLAVLHDNAVFDMRVRSNLYAAEQDAVLNCSLDLTAVCQKRIDGFAVVCVIGWHLVPDFGVYGQLVPENALALFGVQDIHVEFKETLHGVDPPAFSLVFISVQLVLLIVHHLHQHKQEN